MKSYLQSALCFCLALGVGACDQLSQKQESVQGSKKPESVPEPTTQNGRFLPIAPTSGSAMPMIVPWHGFFALDTKTGMLCKTASHEFPKDEWANQLPLCAGLASGHGEPSSERINPELEKELDKDFGPKAK